MGFTLNMMTMLALSLSIGILIDDAIVVIENIHRHLEMGKSPMRAAAEATGEIGLAVMATTASILAVFVPVATMKGIIGRFFVQFGLTVAFAVTRVAVRGLHPDAHAVVALLACAHRQGAGRPGHRTLPRRHRGRLPGRCWARRLRQRALTVLAAVAVFVASIFLVFVVPKEFMPTEDRGMFLVKIELPTGSALAVNETFTESIATKIRAIQGVKDTLVTIGGTVTVRDQPSRDPGQPGAQEERAPSPRLQIMDYVRKEFPGWLAAPTSISRSSPCK